MNFLDELMIAKIKYFAGYCFSKIFPGKTEVILRQFTIPDYVWHNKNRGHFIEKFIRFYLGHQAKHKDIDAPGKLEAYHKAYWQTQNKFHFSSGGRTNQVYIPAFGHIIQTLEEVLFERDIQTVCEFGTGDGKWLNYLSQQWPSIDRFVGVDLSAIQININQSKYQHIEFYCADLTEWVEKNVSPYTLYHTNGGVLEYLSKNAIVRVLDIIRLKAINSMILLIEPIYGDYDIQKTTDSIVSGFEYSYTHNYVHLLKSVGFESVNYVDMEVQGHRWLVVQAYRHIE